MRALLDANIFISYLLSPRKHSPVVTMVNLALSGRFRLLLAEDLVDELVRSVAKRAYLQGRIEPADVSELVHLLSQAGEIIPRITDEIPALTQDAKDDYLIAYALVGEADYLVTGDADLLALKQVDRMRIVTAQELLEVLGETPEMPEGSREE